MEKSVNVQTVDVKDEDMCINMEWGAFGDDGALEDYRNDYDRTVDTTSINKGRQLLVFITFGFKTIFIVYFNESCLCKPQRTFIKLGISTS